MGRRTRIARCARDARTAQSSIHVTTIFGSSIYQCVERDRTLSMPSRCFRNATVFSSVSGAPLDMLSTGLAGCQGATISAHRLSA